MGQKAFTNYLGSDKSTWKEYDTVELLKRGGHKMPIYVDQGTKDNFFCGDVDQLQPKALEGVLHNTEPKGVLHYREGYDHSYYFVTSFIADHFNFHAQYLK